MNESSFKYTAYKALLEGEITRDQYDFITEAGLVSRIIKSLRAAGGAAAKTYKDEAYNDAQQYASQQLQKIVKQIYQAGAKAGQDKSQIDPIVAMILNQAMVDSKIENPALVFKALEKNPEALEVVSEPSSSAASSGEGGSSGGAPLTPDTIKSNPEVAAAVAAAVLPDKKEQIVAAIEKGKKIPPDFIYNAIAANASKKTGVKEEVAQKIVMALVDAKRLTVSANIETVLESIRTRRSGNVIFERWQVLAGVRGKSLLAEVDVPDDIKQALGNDSNAKQFISNLEKDKTVSSGLIKKVKGKLKNSPDLLPQLEDLISQVNVKPGKPAEQEKAEGSSGGTEDQSSKKEELLDKESKDSQGGSEDYENYKDISDQVVEKMRNSDDEELRGLGFYIKTNRTLIKAYEKGGELFDAIRGDEDAFNQAFDKFLADNNITEAEMDVPPDSGANTRNRRAKLRNITVDAYQESKKSKEDSSKEDSKEGSGENNSESQGSDSSGEDLGKIKPILDDIRKKVAVEDASDKDVVSVLKFIKDEIKAIEISTAA